MIQYASIGVHLKYRMIQLFCYHILMIVVQSNTHTPFVRFMHVEKFDDIIENANDTILNILGEVSSSLECVAFCSMHEQCKSVFIYKEDNKICQLRSSVINDMTVPVAKAEARYYKRVENSKESLDCLAGWSQFEGSRYCIVASQATWVEAESDCQRMGCYLVEIESQTEDNFVGKQVRAYGKGIDYWIGATDIHTEGTWLWFNSGNELTYQNWYPGEPNNSNGKQHYGILAYGWSGTTTWQDLTGSVPISYICEC